MMIIEPLHLGSPLQYNPDCSIYKAIPNLQHSQCCVAPVVLVVQKQQCHISHQGCLVQCHSIHLNVLSYAAAFTYQSSPSSNYSIQLPHPDNVHQGRLSNPMLHHHSPRLPCPTLQHSPECLAQHYNIHPVVSSSTTAFTKPAVQSNCHNQTTFIRLPSPMLHHHSPRLSSPTIQHSPLSIPLPQYSPGCLVQNYNIQQRPQFSTAAFTKLSSPTLQHSPECLVQHCSIHQIVQSNTVAFTRLSGPTLQHSLDCLLPTLKHSQDFLV